jgi:serine/threonine-protein kinase
VLLYRLLADESPWSVDTTTQMLSAHIYVEPTPLPRLPGVPGEIVELVHRCLRKIPAERPTAAEAAAILAEAVEGSLPDDSEPVAFPAPIPYEPARVTGEGRSPGAAPAQRRAQALERLAAAHAEMAAAEAEAAVGAEAGAGDGAAAAEEHAAKAAQQGEAAQQEDAAQQGKAVQQGNAAQQGKRAGPQEKAAGPRGTAPDPAKKRKRGVLIAGGGVAAATIAALLLWLFLPTDADGRRDAVTDPPASTAQPPPVAATKPGAPGAGNQPGGSQNGGNATVPGAHLPSATAPGGAGLPTATVTPDPSAPVGAPPTNATPASSAPADGTTTLSSAAGSVQARCGGGKAQLTSWQPTSPYQVERVNAGPVLAATIIFKHANSRIRMTVTCVAGKPKAVVLPL